MPLAEVMDKVRPLSSYWVWAFGLGMLGFIACVARRWAILLVLPPLFLFAVAIGGDVFEDPVSSMIRSEDPTYWATAWWSLVVLPSGCVLGTMTGMYFRSHRPKLRTI